MKATIWTESYQPFRFGGPHIPISTEVEVGGTVDVGKGISVYVIASPNGTLHIAETETGALVGTDLAAVKEDIASASVAVMRRQIEDARKRKEKCENMEPANFWAMLKD